MKARRTLLHVVAALGLAGSQSAFAMVCEFLSDYPPPTPVFQCEREWFFGYPEPSYVWGWVGMTLVSGNSFSKKLKCNGAPQGTHAVWVTYAGLGTEGTDLSCLTF